MKTVLPAHLMFLIVATGFVASAAAKDPELQPFQGQWEVIELVENGHVIPKDAIKEWLPSGGHFDIVDNSMIFTSHDDGKKHAKVFEIDATQFPRGLDLLTREKKEAIGIYKFDEGNLVVCLSDADEGPRPTDFSAKKDSNRMLMVIKKTTNSVPAATPAPTSSAPKLLTEEELTKKLPGSWRHRDELGALVLTLFPNGTWSTTRETQELRLLKKVFVRTSVSSGTWSVKNGTLNLICTSSIHADRVNRSMPFSIRSISETDFIFVDYFGGLGKAVRAQ